jgi:hypothetical protein
MLVASPPRRRSRQQPQDFTIRRSERLAKKSRHRATKPAVQAQNVKMRKLGLTSDTHPPDASSFQQFEEVFSSSLTVSHCEALDALLPAGMDTLATGVVTPV